jgi:pyridoxal phosphate enzyme (YggS family)
MYFYIVKSNAMSIESQIKRFQGELPAGVKLLAVSKFHPVEAIVEAYEAGQRAFGESRPQELKQKYEVLPHDIEWHMIGHLQTNKVKYIAPFVHLIESLDSERLAEEIERQAAKCNRVIDCLLEIHVTAEESKSGWDYAELLAFVQSGGFKALPHIRLRGVMGMATFTDDEAVVRADFERLAACKAELAEYFGEEFDTLSMGMSDDYRLAIEYGSTEVRIGSTIFGERVY